VTKRPSSLIQAATPIVRKLAKPGFPTRPCDAGQADRRRASDHALPGPPRSWGPGNGDRFRV